MLPQQMRNAGAPQATVTTPLVPAAGRVRQMVYGGTLGTLMIVVSASLINLNKYLMSGDRFPYAVALIFMQAVFCTSLAGLVLLLCPSLFPSLTDPAAKIGLDLDFVLKRTSPVALLFTGQLILGNIAYKYASVAFLQMLKESNVATVYCISVLLSLEMFTVRHSLVLLLIMAATVATVQGELHFSAVGLAIQSVCCVCESFRAVVQGMLLAGSGRKLDGLSYVLIVMPQVMLALGMLMLVHLTVHEISFVRLPAFSEIVAYKWVLAGNMLLAFALNLIIALFIKNSSALAFLLANIAKDALIVLGSAMVFREPLSNMQLAAFTVQLALILLWSMMKSFPEAFADGGRFAFLFPAALRERKPVA